MRRFFLALLLIGLQFASASAQAQWREFRSDTDGFTVSLPQTPAITSRRIGTTTATQTNFLIEAGPITYLVSVIQLEKGAGPKNPDRAYFQNLMKNYTEGSTTTLRTSKLATIAGSSGIDGISDAGNSAHQVQVLAVGRPHLHDGLCRAEGSGEQRGPDPIPEFVQAHQLSAGAPRRASRQAAPPHLAGLLSDQTDARTKREHSANMGLHAGLPY